MPAAKTKTYRGQPFDHLKGLDGISDQIDEHLKLYAGYVRQVNALNTELSELRGRGQASGTNPEFAEPTPPANSGLTQALGPVFGSLDQWVKDFHAVGEMRGVGWAIPVRGSND
jgi:Fe-Mn family superoxide dismutase